MYILRLSCQDQPHIVAHVSTALAEAGGNIEESKQFHDPLSGQFFWRCVFSTNTDTTLDAFEHAFIPLATTLDITWKLTPYAQPVKTLLMVSKSDHCLRDLLYRWETGAIPYDIVGVVSNHSTYRAHVTSHNLPFYHLPITPQTKPAQEDALRHIIAEHDAELIVLARYMQVLSDQFCHDYAGRVINIHHSFLPGFKGARPYHQAYERGVKIIGATAHFATSDLDEGPIITQEIFPIDHSFGPTELQATGKDSESRALAHAVKLYTERRIFIHGTRTIIL